MVFKSGKGSIAIFEMGAGLTLDQLLKTLLLYHTVCIYILYLRYKKTVAQLFLRWCIQSGFSTIPKSSNEGRIIENSQVFDWSISGEDIKILVNL